jgi:hypothetical protein
MSAGAVGIDGLVVHSQLSGQQSSYGGPVGSALSVSGGSESTSTAAVGTGIFRVDVIPAARFGGTVLSPSRTPRTMSKLGYRHNSVVDVRVSGGAGSSEGYATLHGQEGAGENGRYVGLGHDGGGQRWAMARRPQLHLMTSSPGGKCLSVVLA